MNWLPAVVLDMVYIDLDEADAALLGRLEAGGDRPDQLTAAVDASADAIADRLAQFEDNGLVNELADGRYELTESGRRVLDSPATAGADERIDTPEDVDRALAAQELRADAEAAVRNAFVLLRNRGDASPVEIVDLVFSEDPAGYEEPEEWWTDLVRDALVALPGVTRSPDGEDLEYEGEPDRDVTR